MTRRKLEEEQPDLHVAIDGEDFAMSAFTLEENARWKAGELGPGSVIVRYVPAARLKKMIEAAESVLRLAPCGLSSSGQAAIEWTDAENALRRALQDARR